MLIRTLFVAIPVSLFLGWSAKVFMRRKSLGSLMQLIGAGSLLIVIWVHILEALHLLAFMHWGEAHSAGHYVDLASAIAGLTLAPTGIALRVLAKSTNGASSRR
jgi:hypothetical protein